MIRINLVDDEALIRAGLNALINTEDDMEVTGQADDGTAVPDPDHPASSS